VKSFGTRGTKEGEFLHPHGVALTCDGHILVTDNHRLQKLTFEGNCVKSVGSSEEGNGRCQFKWPHGVTVHPTTGEIFIADVDNHRIQILRGTFDFRYYNTFGMYGSSQDQFNHPFDVTFDNKGYLYVIDLNNHYIKKFTSTGKYISTFSSYGSNPGQLHGPTSLIIDNNLLYVSEWGNNRTLIMFLLQDSKCKAFSLPVQLT